MGKATLLYKDKAGNKLFQRFIKTRKSWQLFAVNNKGRIVNLSGIKSLAKKARVIIPKQYKHIKVK